MPTLNRPAIAGIATVLLGALATASPAQEIGPQQPWSNWRVHDMTRPKPPVVEPAPVTERAIKPPSDAIILFDGKDLSQWEAAGRGELAAARMEKITKTGVATVAGKTSIRTKQKFGDIQLCTSSGPSPIPKGTRYSQGRGNSGVIIMGLYETHGFIDKLQGRHLRRWPNRARSTGNTRRR